MAANYDVCAADTLTITDNINAGMDYLWSNGVTVNSVSISNGTAIQNLSVEVTDPGNGCVSMFATTVNTTAMPQLSASVIAPPGCSGENELQMTTNVSDHAWQIESGPTFVDVSIVLNYTVQQDGDYRAIATSANGLCSSVVDIGFVLQYPGISQTTVEGFNGIPNITGNPRKFKFGALQPVEVTDYKWYFGDGTTSNSVSPEHTYTGNMDSAIVSLVVTNPVLGPCNYDSTFLKIDVSGQNTTGLADILSDNRFVVYPNPATSIVYINTSALVVSSELFDAVGRRVGQYSRKEINLSALPAGVYTLKSIAKGGEVFIRKINKL